VAGGHARVDDVTLADADAGGDPFVGGLDHLLEIGVGEEAGWGEGSEGADFGANGHTRPKSKAQKMTPEQRSIVAEKAVGSEEAVSGETVSGKAVSEGRLARSY
jgi:hypothetical protein